MKFHSQIAIFILSMLSLQKSSLVLVDAALMVVPFVLRSLNRRSQSLRCQIKIVHLNGVLIHIVV